MASLKEVAKLASVSLMTVSRAINQPQQLKPETLARVQRAIDALNYVPDFSARKIRGKSSKVSTLGVLALETATTPFSVEMLLSIEMTAREFGWSSFLVSITSQQDSERAVNQLLSQRPDGIIYTSMGLREVDIPDNLLDKNLVLANCINRGKPLPGYIPDDFAGQYQAMKTVIQRGYRHPLCFWLPQCTPASISRRAGAEQAWRETGLPETQLRQVHMTWGDEHYRDVVAILDAAIVQGKANFDVLICGNDRIAFLAYQVLLSRGIAIPQQVAVLGYDNMVGIGDLFLPPLTTVQLPHVEIGREAVLHLIEQRGSQGLVKIASPLLERASL
ncbi:MULTISPECIES: LacI family DNA-binding transcriptional regulator [Winslowiella]|uniref:LacI family DNA-binding transcriptional regulator n=1 Tax=Winslowiella TaxID=2997349 RepID=UPI0028BED1FE|nr:LacI family DNA-binding transcriptional regulator [Winslowiella toletana]WNN45967.1 LacI family DNA-binding transcriptional regulator [Winslowiella toletana]